MPDSKEHIADLAFRYGSPIGVPAGGSVREVKDMAKQLLAGFSEYFFGGEDLGMAIGSAVAGTPGMVGGGLMAYPTELGDATLTGNQDLLDAANARRSLFNEIMGLENGEQ